MSDFGAIRSVWASRLRPRACLVALILSGAAAAAGAVSPSEGLSLRLDSDLMPRLDGAAVDREWLVGVTEAPVLRSRIYKVRDQVEALDQLGKERAAQLTDREHLIQRMREVVSAQEQVIATLRNEIAKPRPAAAVPAPASARPAALSVSETAAKPPSVRSGPEEPPAAAGSYLTEGALGVVILVLLGWALHLRSSANTKAAELVVLRRHSARRQKPAPEPDFEAAATPVAESQPPAQSKRPAAGGPRRKAPAAEKQRRVPAPPPQKTDADTAPEIEATAAFEAPAQSAPLKEADTPTPFEAPPRPDAPRTKAAKRPEGPPPLTLDSEADDDTVDFVIGEERRGEGAADETMKVDDAKAGRRPRPTRDRDESDAPPLILDLEADDETIDFLTEIYGDEEDEEKK